MLLLELKTISGFKIAKFEFDVTIHCGMCSKTSSWNLKMMFFPLHFELNLISFVFHFNRWRGCIGFSNYPDHLQVPRQCWALRLFCYPSIILDMQTVLTNQCLLLFDFCKSKFELSFICVSLPVLLEKHDQLPEITSVHVKIIGKVDISLRLSLLYTDKFAG